MTNLKPGKDYIGVGAGAVIINDEGKIFLAQRGEKAKNERGKWEFPGGSVEYGETLAQALTREIDEEYGFIIKPVKLLTVTDHILVEEHQHWVSPAFFCKVISGLPEIKEPEKCSKIGWFSLQDIEKMDLTIPAAHNVQVIKENYPKGIFFE